MNRARPRPTHTACVAYSNNSIIRPPTTNNKHIHHFIQCSLASRIAMNRHRRPSPLHSIKATCRNNKTENEKKKKKKHAIILYLYDDDRLRCFITDISSNCFRNVCEYMCGGHDHDHYDFERWMSMGGGGWSLTPWL